MSVYRWEPALDCKFGNLCSIRIEDGAGHHEDCTSTPLACGSECSLNILGTLYGQVLKLYFERRGGEFDFFYMLGDSGSGRGSPSQDRDAGELGNNLFQKLQLFSP